MINLLYKFFVLILILLGNFGVSFSQSIGNGLETPECMGTVIYFNSHVFDNDNWRISESDISQRVSSKLLETNLLPVNTNTTDRRPDNCHTLMDRGMLRIFIRTFHNTSQVSVSFIREAFYLVAENEYKRNIATTTFDITTHGYSESKSNEVVNRMLDQNLGRFMDQYKSANSIR